MGCGSSHTGTEARRSESAASSGQKRNGNDNIIKNNNNESKTTGSEQENVTSNTDNSINKEQTDIPDKEIKPPSEEAGQRTSEGGNTEHCENEVAITQDECYSGQETEQDEFSELEILALNAHNKYRAMHGAPPLKLNRELCDMSRKYAEYLAKHDKFEHSTDSKFRGDPCGENLYSSTGMANGAHAGEIASKCFYDEIKHYDYNQHGFSMNTGHFTQVVWNNTQLLGVGIGTRGGSAVVCCNYYPAGNYQGCFPDNVNPVSAQSAPEPDNGQQDVNNNAKDVATTQDEQTGEFSESEVLALDAHNKYRALHGAPPLELNREICDMAQKYAEYLAENDKFEHSKKENRTYKGQGCGENLYGSSGMATSVKEGVMATKSFYDEIKDYDYQNQGFSMGTGHFTQVVWSSTKLLGIGIARHKRSTVICCNYFPPGNYQGQFPENVNPLI